MGNNTYGVSEVFIGSYLTFSPCSKLCKRKILASQVLEVSKLQIHFSGSVARLCPRHLNGEAGFEPVGVGQSSVGEQKSFQNITYG
jgi:hypothetical protein